MNSWVVKRFFERFLGGVTDHHQVGHGQLPVLGGDEVGSHERVPRGAGMVVVARSGSYELPDVPDGVTYRRLHTGIGRAWACGRVVGRVSPVFSITSRSHRFFITAPSARGSGVVTPERSMCHHTRSVVNCSPGDRVVTKSLATAIHARFAASSTRASASSRSGTPGVTTGPPFRGGSRAGWMRTASARGADAPASCCAPSPGRGCRPSRPRSGATWP